MTTLSQQESTTIQSALSDEAYLIKRDGSHENIDPLKLIKWGEWGRRNLGDRVKWSQIMTDTLDQIKSGMTTSQVQDLLIKNTLRFGDDAHSLMAGTLYAPSLQKDIYPDGIPTIKDLQITLRNLGLMKHMAYSDAEYAQLQAIIDHTIDFGYRHFQIKHITRKYSIQNRDTNKIYETPQFTFMRMAMEVYSKEPAVKRIELIREFYKYLAGNMINAPSPNYISLGTPQSGLVSCCLYKTDDTIASLNTGDTIAYRMTAIGAGIGGMIATRGLGETVRNGSIIHQGKQPYYAIMGKAVKGNIQSGRAGAAKVEYNIFDVEAYQIAGLQNPRTPASRRNRDMHFAVQYHSLFIRKALLNEDVFTFSPKSTPDLFLAFYGPDKKKFEELYNKYEADDNFKKHYVSARDLLLMTSRQGPEVGTHYEFYSDNVNSNTPYKEPIYCSNLCVAPETMLLTDKGNFPIQTLEGQTVNVWNGEDFSETTVVKTGVDQELWEVKTSNGKSLSCTPYHKWYIISDRADDYQRVHEKRTYELKPGDKLIDFYTPVIDGCNAETTDDVTIVSVINNGRTDDTYCVTEPKRHMAVFNGILTGQCMEILQPTWHYEDLWQLYVNDYLGKIKLKAKDTELIYDQAMKFMKIGNKDPIPGGELEEGMTVYQEGDDESKAFTIDQVIDRDRQPETSLCALGGLVVCNIHDDHNYERAMYHTQRMINYCIMNSTYPFPQIEFTAKKRMNAGIGMLGVATCLARKNFRYDSVEGINAIHRLSERHMYFAIKCSIQLGKELGNAPWINKTKWPEGWMPIDTYNKSVDEVCKEPLHYDWEELRGWLIANKGMRFSSLVAHMPTESSSKSTGCPNGVYPIRELAIGKSDATNTIDWTAPDSDLIGRQYQLAYDIDIFKLIDGYSVIQKFSDGSISADEYMDRRKTLDLSASQLLKITAHKQRRGMKTRYYVNSRTDDNMAGNLSAVAGGCASGACTL